MRIAFAMISQSQLGPRGELSRCSSLQSTHTCAPLTPIPSVTMPHYARCHARIVSRGVLRRTRTLLSAGLACAASSLGLFAQQTTTTTANDEPIKLNPFTISAKQEKGYRASNSV